MSKNKRFPLKKTYCRSFVTNAGKKDLHYTQKFRNLLKLEIVKLSLIRQDNYESICHRNIVQTETFSTLLTSIAYNVTSAS